MKKLLLALLIVFIGSLVYFLSSFNALADKYPVCGRLEVLNVTPFIIRDSAGGRIAGSNDLDLLLVRDNKTGDEYMITSGDDAVAIVLLGDD